MLTYCVSPPQSSGVSPSSESWVRTRSGFASGLSIFVHRDDNRNFRVLGMVYRFESLRHNSVVRRHYKHNDVGDLSTARAHHRKDFVARSVEESDFSFFAFHDIRANALRDSADFAFGDMAFSNRVERFCLSVINVSHNRHNRRARQSLVLVGSVARDDGFVVKAHEMDFAIVFGRQNRRRVAVDGLSDCHHLSHRHQFRDDFARLEIHLARQILNRNSFHDVDFRWHDGNAGFHLALCFVKFVLVKSGFLVLAAVDLLFSLE